MSTLRVSVPLTTWAPGAVNTELGDRKTNTQQMAPGSQVGRASPGGRLRCPATGPKRKSTEAEQDCCLRPAWAKAKLNKRLRK